MKRFQHTVHRVQSARQVLQRLVQQLVRALASLSLGKKVTLAVIATVGVYAVFFIDTPPLSQVRAYADQADWWLLPVFFILYIVITQFPIPRTFLTLSSGILFGPVVGCVVALSATTISGGLALWGIRKFFVNDAARARINGRTIDAINARLKARGWLAIASLRMIGAVPFFVLNLTASFTQVSLKHFVIATFVGSAPATIATVFIGDALTGAANPALIGVTGVLLTLGLIGLALDYKLPVA